MRLLEKWKKWRWRKKVGLVVLFLILIPIPVYSQEQVCFPCQPGLGCPGCSHWITDPPIIIRLYYVLVSVVR